jgi:DNA-binding Lrp family transcriptional regulator
MRGRKPKHDNRIVRYVTNHGPTTQAVLAKALKIPAASIYVIVKRLVEQGRVHMDDKFVTLPFPKDDPRMPIFGKRVEEMPKVDAPVHPLIKIFQEEIEDIDAGIRSLQITRSYMVRRIEDIRVNG